MKLKIIGPEVQPMNGDSDPYAPPAADPTGPPPSLAWRIEDKILMVRNGAELPAIDLRGRDDTDLVHRSRRLAANPPFMSFVKPMAPLLVVASLHSDLKLPLWTIPVIILLPLVLDLAFSRRGKIGYFTGQARERRRRIWKITGRILMLLAVGFGFHEWISLATDLGWVIAVLLIVSLFILVGPASDRIVCTRYADGWFHLSGVPRLTLRRLRKLHPDSSSDADGLS